MSLTRVTKLPNLPARPAEGHKGMFGHVLLVAGSRGMSGAAVLSGLGALRGGAGLVTVAVPQELLPIVASVEPAFLTRGLPGTEAGQFASAARTELEAMLPHHRVLAFGPGWGKSSDLTQLARCLFANAKIPAVIDADGLNALAEHPDDLANAPAPRVLTPHPGEFSRLTGIATKDLQQNREPLAIDFARQHKVVLLLKGASTIITDGERIAVNTTGNSGMATGGTGDVLTGLISALLGQGMPAFEAAQLGAYLHGLAGDLAAAELTRPALIASDLPRYLPFAWKQAGAT